MRARLSRRVLMYLVVGVQMLVLGAVVVPQELNIALDPGGGVDLEITGARGQKDPFRGAYVTGRSALDLDGAKAALPAERLRAGDKVLVFFAFEPDRRPRIVRVERRRLAADPPFGPAGFSIPGKVLGRDERRYGSGGTTGPVARVGDPAVPVALEVPDSVAIDESALDRIVWPSLIRATLHRGYLGYRYLTDVQLIGRGWQPEVGLAYDETREHLIVLSPRVVFLLVIEAGRSQLSKLAPDGRVVWRVPRFQGLAWLLAEPGGGGGWVGAMGFEGRPGGVFRFGGDGSIAGITAEVHPTAPPSYPLAWKAAGALRDPRHGRLYVREPQAISILGADGTLLRRVEGFHYASPQRIRD